MTTNVKTMLTVIDSRESLSPRRCVEVSLAILLISAYVLANGIVLQIADAQISTSIETLRELAIKGNAESQYQLGRAYANGDSVSQDFREAHRWFTRAANKGHRSAQRALATMYTEGDGVPPDAEVAAHWLSLSEGEEVKVKAKRIVRDHKANESATEVSKGFEILDLLERFIPDSDRVPRSWSTGTNEGLPITWETQGVSSITAGKFASERVGTVVLTVRGEPAYKVLRKQVEPGKWQLRLLGAEYGYHAFELDEMEFTGATSAYGNRFIAEQLGDNAKWILTCEPVRGLSGRKYRLSLPGKMESWLWETKSCGSGGCSTSLKVFLLEGDASVDQCLEESLTGVADSNKADVVKNKSAEDTQSSAESGEPAPRKVTCKQFSTVFGRDSEFTDLQKQIAFEHWVIKDVDWVGEVVDVRVIFGSLVISIKCADATFVSDVDVYLKKSEVGKAASLQKGMKMRFRGRLTAWGEIMNHTVEDATIVDM